MSMGSIILFFFLIADSLFVISWASGSYIRRKHQRQYWRAIAQHPVISNYNIESLIKEINDDFNNSKIIWP